MNVEKTPFRLDQIEDSENELRHMWLATYHKPSTSKWEADMCDDEDFLSALDREIARETRHGTWPAYIVRALLARPVCTEKRNALKAIRRDCEKRGHTMPRTFPDVVQAAFEAHNAGSDVFKSEDLFYFAGSKGDGKWGLHLERAKAWMATRGYELPENLEAYTN